MKKAIVNLCRLLLAAVFILSGFVKAVDPLGTLYKMQDYLLAMERSPIRDIEIKHLFRSALTNKVNDREVYMKGIDHSYYYEGYTMYRIADLK